MSDISSLADCYEDHNYRELQSEIKVLRDKLGHLEAKNGCLEKTQCSSRSIIDSLKNSLEMSEISNKLLQERCQYLENNLIEKNKELSAAKKEVESTRQIVSDNTRDFSQSHSKEFLRIWQRFWMKFLLKNKLCVKQNRHGIGILEKSMQGLIMRKRIMCKIHY